jgi:rhamnosyltransferase
VLVLLATYQGRPFVDQQIASILWQIDVVPRILLRDDGSADDTLAACEAWATREPASVSILRDDVRTGSASGNFFRLLAAAELGNFDYVALADQDDVWFPDKLARAVAAMRADGADGYSSDLLAVDEVTRASWMMDKAGRDADLDYLFQGASAGCTYVLSVAGARLVRDVMASIDGDWPGGMSHDWTIYAACRSRGLRWVRDRRPGLLYRQHGGNDYGARAGLGGLLQRFRAVRDDWYRNHVLWLRRVVAMTPAERRVFEAIERGERRWLASNAFRFRRSRRDARLLALSFLARLF